MRFLRGERRGDGVALLLKDQPVSGEHGCFIIHHQDAHFFGFLRHRVHSFTIGRSILKTVPLPTLLRTEILPPWFPMMPFTIHNPNPVPFSPFVVTNGSNTVFTMFGGIPEPVSASTMRIHPCRPSLPVTCRVRTYSLPPFAMLSFALMI